MSPFQSDSVFFPSTPLQSLSRPGGDEEDRTPDPLRARQVLSQLSYTPMGAVGLWKLFRLSPFEDPFGTFKIKQHVGFLPEPCLTRV